MNTHRLRAGAVMALLCLVAGVAGQTPMINELDCDQAGTDAGEFVEIWTPAPNVPLNGYVLVFYNGATDTAYLAIDLSGFSTDSTGFLLVGNSTLIPVPAVVFPGNTLQNGPDAVALHFGSLASFPNGTPVTAVGLVDAVVYDTSDANDLGLLSVLTPGQPQIDENIHTNAVSESIHRCGDGQGGPLVTTSYVVGVPTPGASNPGPCGPINPFTISITQNIPACGPITLVVSGASPGADLFNLISVQCSNGQGPLFGIGFDAFNQIFLPLGIHPFHVTADASGGYSLSLQSACAIGYTIEAVSIDAVGYTIVQVSATTGCVNISL